MTRHEKKLYILFALHLVISSILFYSVFVTQESTDEALDIYGRSIIELYKIIAAVTQTAI